MGVEISIFVLFNHGSKELKVGLDRKKWKEWLLITCLNKNMRWDEKKREELSIQSIPLSFLKKIKIQSLSKKMMQSTIFFLKKKCCPFFWYISAPRHCIYRSQIIYLWLRNHTCSNMVFMYLSHCQKHRQIWPHPLKRNVSGLHPNFFYLGTEF